MTHIMKSHGLVELVVDVVMFVLHLFVLVMGAFDKPKWFHDSCDPDSFSKPSGSQIS